MQPSSPVDDNQIAWLKEDFNKVVAYFFKERVFTTSLELKPLKLN